VISLLQQYDEGDAKILAGGQSLMPLLSMRMTRPVILIDLARLPDLDFIREESGMLAIGAMTRKRDVEESDLVRRRQPMLLAATQLVGHPQIRNRGTVGGSMAHADPAAEYPALALTLGAEFRAVSAEGERSIAAEDFFLSYLTTALGDSEVLTEVRVPVLGEGVGWSFLEMARRHGDFALGGAAMTVELDRGGNVTASRVVLFGIGATAVRVPEVEQMLQGERPDEGLFQEVRNRTSEVIDEPLSDTHASADYRRNLAGVLMGRALREAVSRASVRS
jgi:carbon-monoxide dehydrogenase medium subunit